MFDRIIASAGAVSAAVDRFVRSVTPGRAMAAQPASLLIAGLLGVVALVLVVFGFESSAGAALQRLDPAAVATADGLANRVYATLDGRVPSSYVETYLDEDGDGVQDPEEVGAAWEYVVLGEGSPAGVLVRSETPPWEVYTIAASGVVVDDATFVRDDTGYWGSDLSIRGLILDQDSYIDATSGGTGIAHDLADELPVAGTRITLSGARAIEYVPYCSADPDADGTCDDDEVDLYDVIAYDPLTLRAVIVATDASPEFQPASFTGILRRDVRAIAESLATLGSPDELGFTIAPTHLLQDGAVPADATFLFLVAGLLAMGAVVIVLGVVGGYVPFRSGGPPPAGATTMVAGERVPLRVTGLLRGPEGLVHVREAAADLVRFVLVPSAPAPDPEPAPDLTSVLESSSPTAVETSSSMVTPEASASIVVADPYPSDEPPTTLIVERLGRPEGLAVGLGELAQLDVGTLITPRDGRPAIRMTAGTGRVLVSFDSLEARDRAAAELVAESGIGFAGAPTEEGS